MFLRLTFVVARVVYTKCKFASVQAPLSALDGQTSNYVVVFVVATCARVNCIAVGNNLTFVVASVHQVLIRMQICCKFASVQARLSARDRHTSNCVVVAAAPMRMCKLHHSWQ